MPSIQGSKTLLFMFDTLVLNSLERHIEWMLRLGVLTIDTLARLDTPSRWKQELP